MISRSSPKPANVGNVELCRIVDQHEHVRPDVHVRQRVDCRGMNWWQAILTVFIGNCVVLLPMVLNGHAGASLRNPLSHFCPQQLWHPPREHTALLRAIVGCGWFGIQTWIGGHSLYQLVHVWNPAVEDIPRILPAWFGLETGPAITFFAFWLLNMLIVHLGIESIRKLLFSRRYFFP